MFARAYGFIVPPRAILLATVIAAASSCTCGSSTDPAVQPDGGNAGAGGASEDSSGSSGQSGSGGSAGSAANDGGVNDGGIESGRQDAYQPGDTGTAGSDSGPEPIDWKLPFDEAYQQVWKDELSWRNSSEVYCSEGGFLVSEDVWSDERGVFALVATGTPPLDVFVNGEGSKLPIVYFNDGNGWKIIYRYEQELMEGLFESPFEVGLTGVRNGPLLLYGGLIECGVRFIENNVSTCRGDLTPILDSEPRLLYDLFPVTDDLAYGVDGTDRIYRYQANAWTEIPIRPRSSGELAVGGIWADEEMLVVGANDQQIFIRRAGETDFELQMGVPVGGYYNVWALSADNIFAANSGGQLVRYDGSGWNVVWTADFVMGRYCHNIVGMWGDGDTLYFITMNTFGRWMENGVEIVAQWPCDGGPRFTDIWGNSASEVFLSVNGWGSQGTRCGETSLIWYDGNYIRPL
jgi:hypothetical protein